MKCEFCKNNFKTISSLNYHKKTAKYCLKIQTQKGLKIKILNKCIYCQKTFSQKIDYEKHNIKCVKRNVEITKDTYNQQFLSIKQDLSHSNLLLTERDNTIIELKTHIKELEDRLENVAIKAIERPTTTTTKTTINNFIQNLQPITEEVMIENVPNLTIDHIKKGPSGYAEYALEYPLKDRIVCTDFSRRKIKYKDSEGNVITDPEMNNLAKKFFSSIKDKNEELIIKYGKEFKEKFGDHMGVLVDIYGYKMDVRSSSEGSKPDFLHDFIKHVCSQTIKDE